MSSSSHDGDAASPSSPPPVLPSPVVPVSPVGLIDEGPRAATPASSRPQTPAPSSSLCSTAPQCITPSVSGALSPKKRKSDMACDDRPPKQVRLEVPDSCDGDSSTVAVSSPEPPAGDGSVDEPGTPQSAPGDASGAEFAGSVLLSSGGCGDAGSPCPQPGRVERSTSG